MRILTVDDDPIFLSILEMELRALGYGDVTTAPSAAAALELVQHAQQPFDCFLLDIEMPHMDGVDLCHALKQDPVTAQTPIVMVTVRADMGSIDRAFAAGATDYLTKPLERRCLQGRMQMVKQLTQERNRQQEVGAANHDFAEPLALAEVSRTITYLALQNYMLKQNAARLLTSCVVGLRIENAYDIFVQRGASGYRDMLLDLAEIIGEGFKFNETLIAHAGFGDFVAFSRGTHHAETQQILEGMEYSLDALARAYHGIGDIAPRVRVGAPARRPFFSMMPADALLDQALKNVDAGGHAVAQTAYMAGAAAPMQMDVA